MRQRNTIGATMTAGRLGIAAALIMMLAPAPAHAGYVWVCRNTTTDRTPVGNRIARQHLNLNFNTTLVAMKSEDNADREDETDLQAALGMELDWRRHGTGRYSLGGRVMVGKGISFGDEQGKPAVLVEPLLGLQLTSQENEHTMFAPGSYVAGARRCDGEYRLRNDRTHVLGVRPLYMRLNDRDFIGGHVVWEFDLNRQPKGARYALTGKSIPLMQKIIKYGLRIRLTNALKAGYIHGMGVGGAWEMNAQLGGLNTALDFGVYKSDSYAVNAGARIGYAF